MATQDPLRHYWLFPSGPLVDAGDIEHAGYVRKYPARFRLTPRQVSRDLDKSKLIALAIRSSGAVAITRTVPRGFERITLTGAFRADPGILRKAASAIEYEGWPGDVDAWDVGGTKVRMLATNPARDRLVIRSGRNPLLMVVPNERGGRARRNPAMGLTEMGSFPSKDVAIREAVRLAKREDMHVYVTWRSRRDVFILTGLPVAGATEFTRVYPDGRIEPFDRRDIRRNPRGRPGRMLAVYCDTPGRIKHYQGLLTKNAVRTAIGHGPYLSRGRRMLFVHTADLGRALTTAIKEDGREGMLAYGIRVMAKAAGYTLSLRSTLNPGDPQYKRQLAQARKERASLERKQWAHLRDLERRWAKIEKARVKANPGTDMGSISRTPDFQKGLKLYRQIHGCDPKSIKRTIMRLGPNDNKVTGRVVLVSMGKAPADSYEPPKGSRKEGRIWVHPYDNKPEKVVTVDGKTIITMPGTHAVKAGPDGEAWIHG